jgi:hypothetical protein
LGRLHKKALTAENGEVSRRKRGKAFNRKGRERKTAKDAKKTYPILIGLSVLLLRLAILVSPTTNR